MFIYEKRLQYPVNIKTPNPKLAAVIISQYGGPDINTLLFPTADRCGEIFVQILPQIFARRKFSHPHGLSLFHAPAST